MFGLGGMAGVEGDAGTSQPAVVPDGAPAPAPAPAPAAQEKYDAATEGAIIPSKPPLASQSDAKPAEVVKPSDKPQVPATSTSINWLALGAALGVVWLATKYLRRS